MSNKNYKSEPNFKSIKSENHKRGIIKGNIF